MIARVVFEISVRNGSADAIRIWVKVADYVDLANVVGHIGLLRS